MINIPPQRIEHINAEALRILQEMKELPYCEKVNSSSNGSINEKELIDLTDKVTDSPIRISDILINGEKVNWMECWMGKCYGFDESLYPDFLKLVKIIEKDKAIKSIVSVEFLHSKCFDWFIGTYTNRIEKSNLSDFIVKEILESIREYVIQFPVLYLEIEGTMEIGRTRLAYYTKEYLEKQEELFLSENPERKDDNIYEFLKKELQGQVFITYIAKAEGAKAKEIAYEECSLAIDVLKLCSLTTESPNYKVSFDIDSRTTESPRNRVFYAEISKQHEFLFDLYAVPNIYKIDKKEWESMLHKQLKDFHVFLLNKEKYDTELKKLIVSSIKRYATAISKADLNQRIVELFTILESLLLNDDNVAIIESVCKYSSKLVFQKIEDRKYSITLLKEMYGIRSAMIHHAQRREFDVDKLRKLQLIVLMLILQLIKRIEIHKTKASILKEIDDEILKAY